MLDLRRLRVLDAVARGGSFAAADTLDYTASAIGQQVATLERETGMQLVVRGARGVTLTQAGRLLASHADAILARVANAEAELTALGDLKGGCLRLAAFSSAGQRLLPAAIASFRSRHPEVELSLLPQATMDQVHAAEVDLALIFNYDMCQITDTTGLDCIPVLDDPVHLALPADHDLVHRSALALGDVSDQRWIQCVTPSCATFLTRVTHLAGFEPRIAFQTDDYAAVLGLVATGVGVALIPQLALTAVPDEVAIRPVQPEPPIRQISAVLAPEAHRAPATAAMIDALTEAASTYTQADVLVAA